MPVLSLPLKGIAHQQPSSALILPARSKAQYTRPHRLHTRDHPLSQSCTFPLSHTEQRLRQSVYSTRLPHRTGPTQAARLSAGGGGRGWPTMTAINAWKYCSSRASCCCCCCYTWPAAATAAYSCVGSNGSRQRHHSAWDQHGVVSGSHSRGSSSN